MAAYVQQGPLDSRASEAPMQEYHNFLFLDSMASDHTQQLQKMEPEQAKALIETEMQGQANQAEIVARQGHSSDTNPVAIEYEDGDSSTASAEAGNFRLSP